MNDKLVVARVEPVSYVPAKHLADLLDDGQAQTGSAFYAIALIKTRKDPGLIQWGCTSRIA